MCMAWMKSWLRIEICIIKLKSFKSHHWSNFLFFPPSLIAFSILIQLSSNSETELCESNGNKISLDTWHHFVNLCTRNVSFTTILLNFVFIKICRSRQSISRHEIVDYSFCLVRFNVLELIPDFVGIFARFLFFGFY